MSNNGKGQEKRVSIQQNGGRKLFKIRNRSVDDKIESKNQLERIEAKLDKLLDR